MARLLTAITLIAMAAGSAWGASVGSGSPNAQVQQSFIDAFNRGRFSQRVLLPPAKDVHALGSPGLVQEFASKTDGSTYALVTPDPTLSTAGLTTLQIYGDVYAFFNSLGAGTVGYPLNDTTGCAPNGLGSCEYQLFSKNYALFVYSGQNDISVHDPFFTEWTNGGGIQVYGAALTLPAAVTSPSNAQGMQQVFAAGTIFSYPNSAATPAVFGIAVGFNTAFNNAGGYAHLGFPTSDVSTVNAAGLIRQTFEMGRIEMTPGNDPVVFYAIASIGIPGQAQGLNLAVGATATLNASVVDTRSQTVTGRALNWSTSNGSVVRVVGNGDTATITAVGPGTSNIYVSGEGITSTPFTVRVSAPCCTVGNGAPTASISQAFQASVDRNGLSVVLPAAAISRLGNGYVETLTAANAADTQYILSEADNSGFAYLLAANLTGAYFAAGGFTGALGYPASDPLPGGAQKFTSGAALGGSPVHVVPAAVATKWFQLGGAPGAAGSPSGDSSAFNSAAGGAGNTLGISQAFTGGEIFALMSGAKAGQAFFSSGPILSRYLALGGIAGVLGLPLSDITAGVALKETFEGGYIDLQPGAATAIEHLNPRHPALTLSSATVVPGGRIHISATGFTLGATLVFTITGQPGFSIQAPSGAFTWDVVVPAGTRSGAVSIQVAAQGISEAAQATYNVTSLALSLPQLAVISGDRQTGLPGSTLASPIIAQLRDSTGNPLSGVPVIFSGSPGASAQSSFVTDQNGQVALNFRLPPLDGVAVGSLNAGPQVVNFSALASDGAIQNFPVFSQTDPAGSLTAALAALLRYYQNQGSLPAPNGLASPAALSQYLTAKGGYVEVAPGDRIVNPWIAAQYGGAALWLESTSPDHIRDLLNGGTPVVLILNLSIDGGVDASNAVDAIGVGADGSILIDDPNPIFGRTSLTDYLNGFPAQGHQVQASVAAVLRAGSAMAAGPGPFTVASQVTAAAVTSSAAGACVSVDILSSVSSLGERFQYCDGGQSAYEFDSATQGGAVVSDLSGGAVQQIPPNAGVSWNISRAAGTLAISPQALVITGVTDSAAFGTLLAPGELITIFGTGFSVAPVGQQATVTLNGIQIPVVSAFPFQLNVLIPQSTAGGVATLQVQGALGVASKALNLAAVAPAIFAIGSQGAIVNAGGALNTPQVPAQRGQYVSIYCTGLGTTTPQKGFEVATSPVTVLINDAPLIPDYAGLAPGFPGLYQINVTVPGNLPPALTGTIAIQQDGQKSNKVGFSLD